jgi:hypothetical protein
MQGISLSNTENFKQSLTNMHQRQQTRQVPIRMVHSQRACKRQGCF